MLLAVPCWLLTTSQAVAAPPALTPAAKEQPATTPSTTPATRPLAHASSQRHLLLISQAAPSTERMLERVRARLLGSRSFVPLPLAALFPLMRQADDTKESAQKVDALKEAARKAMLALDHQKAQQAIDRALELSGDSYLRLYAPRTVAALHLLAGVLSLQRVRPDLAERHFVSALALQPDLTLDAHYSPQVRSAFTRAVKQNRPTTAPLRGRMAQLVALDARVGHGLVLSSEKSGGDVVLLKALFFSRSKGAYTTVESTAIARSDSEVASTLKRFGDRVRRSAERIFPAPEVQVTQTQPTTKPASQPAGFGSKPPVKRWYQRWYVWAGAAALVATAIVVPMMARQDVVDVKVSWSPTP